MATLSELETSGSLERIEIELDGSFPHRILYGTPQFIEWLSNTLPGLQTGLMNAELSPYEQVFARFRSYIVGEELRGDRRFAPLSCHPEQFVWELKTVDVRVFGWVPKMDRFICCFGAHADLVKRLKLYRPFIEQVARVRSLMALTDPKSIEFKEYENVLSDAD